MTILLEQNHLRHLPGFTGSRGTLYMEKAITCGATMVGGVVPGRGIMRSSGLSVFAEIIWPMWRRKL